MPPKATKTRSSTSTATSEIPEGIPVGLWDMFLSIKADTSITSQRVEQLETRVDELENTPSATANTPLVEQVDTLSKTVTLLAAKLAKCEIKCGDLNDQLDSMRAHSMKNNLIFNFDKDNEQYKEVKGENCVDLVKSFLGNVLGIGNANDIYIPVAHRIGRRNPNFTRSIIAKFPISNEFDLVLKNTNRLRSTRHYVAKQLTAKQRERKKYILPVFKDLKSNPDNNARVVDDKLFVKGNLQVKYRPPKIPPPLMNNPSLELLHGDNVTDSGSTFTGFVAKVTSMQDVSDILQMAKTRPEIAAANHLIFAYRIGQRQNFDSDGDYGVGLHLLHHMQEQDMNNIICIVTRKCTADFTHIGNRRMEHAVKVCEKGIAGIIE
jgi:hypothetical protein